MSTELQMYEHMRHVEVEASNYSTTFSVLHRHKVMTTEKKLKEKKEIKGEILVILILNIKPISGCFF